MDRSKFKISKKASKVFIDNAEKTHADFKPMYIDWDKLGELPQYKEIVNRTESDFEDNVIQILPYIITSSNNVWVAKGLLPKGGVAYQNRVFRHAYVGTAKKNFICPKRMYNMPCPLCDELTKLYKGKPKGWQKPREYNFLGASARDFYLVVPLVGEQAGQVCLYEVSNFLFTTHFEKARIDFIKSTVRDNKRLYEQQQALIAQGKEITGKLITRVDFEEPDITDPDNGFDVRFIIGVAKKGDFDSNEYSGFKFLPRQAPISDTILNKTFDLSEHFIMTDYNESLTLMQESFNEVVDAKNGVETTTGDDDETFTYPADDSLPFDDAGTQPITDEAAIEADKKAIETPKVETTAPVVESTADTAPADGRTPCPKGIEKKNSQLECMMCPPEIKNVCNRI
jgi:hypothetical protein